ncbi:MarR family winged helix-turn-helix transcriptional regulator [Actinomycetospora sp. TBRC 11914]|uniref:MarR family winged helix-turn-helix transcriptional regulator n=1 Tax=Actinomycetospora sp. TBRC 11914 TaxID=2729387 RepID=UPI00145C4111|nr:MarR family winged helix-turn-helix transcriptional regulator [Actinomycetospora sp. TBRC 11914]NMO90578.1 winged helix-turn-helix transcriptional regulator [Actinomycetospora sp. TBRC 11914]
MTRQNGSTGRDGARPQRSEATGATAGDAAGGGPPNTPEPLRSTPGFLVRRLYQAHAAAWLRHVDTALTGPQFAVMTAVQAYPRVDQGSLATCVALDRSTMADVCRRLEDRALIQRDTAPADGRRKLLSLTAQGESVLADVTRRVSRLNLRLMDGDEDTDGFAELLLALDQLSERWEQVADEDAV